METKKTEEKLDELINVFRGKIIPAMETQLEKAPLSIAQHDNLSQRLEFYKNIYIKTSQLIREVKGIKAFLKQICKSLEEKDVYDKENMTIKPKNLMNNIQYFAVVLLSLFAYSDDYGFSEAEKEFFMNLLENPSKIRDII